MEDTIVALASALGESSVHLIRLSGNKALSITNECFEPRNPERWNEDINYTLHLGKFYGEKRQLLDEVLIGKMRMPHSFTGEDTIEINCHGGLFVAQRIISECLRLGARLADAGEFSKRAFLNGKLDLVQAEAIVDLIAAKTAASADLALNQLSGELSSRIMDLKEQVLETLAFIEAGIDFPEDDVEDLDRHTLKSRLCKAIDLAEFLIEGSRTGKILRDGLLTVIVGLPNVGKSSLLNALLREDRAIVTDIPGTTRDEIRESVNVGSILLQLVDTAGIRVSTDPVEKLGIERSWKAVSQAELVLLIIEAGSQLNQDEVNILKEHPHKIIILVNKTDLLPSDFNILSWIKYTLPSDIPSIPFSIAERTGFLELETEILKRVYGERARNQEPLLSNARQISALQRALTSLRDAVAAVEGSLPWDIVSIDVRQTLQEISLITGDNIQETLLDDIFSRFCIGK